MSHLELESGSPEWNKVSGSEFEHGLGHRKYVQVDYRLLIIGIKDNL